MHAKAENDGRDAKLDHYDRRAIGNLSTDTSVSTTTIYRRYRSAGILEKEKIKRRLKRLDPLGILRHDGTRWFVTGGDA